MKNDLSTYEGLKREFDKQALILQNITEAFQKSDKAKVYRDGYDYAKRIVQNFRMGVSGAENI